MLSGAPFAALPHGHTHRRADAAAYADLYARTQPRAAYANPRSAGHLYGDAQPGSYAYRFRDAAASATWGNNDAHPQADIYRTANEHATTDEYEHATATADEHEYAAATTNEYEHATATTDEYEHATATTDEYEHATTTGNGYANSGDIAANPDAAT